MKRLILIVVVIGIAAALWAVSGAQAVYQGDYVRAQRGPK
jgi:hypothetical protein